MAWPTTSTLKSWLLPANTWGPGAANSNLIINDIVDPTIPENIANIKYNIAISLALVEYNHRCIYIIIGIYYTIYGYL